MNDYFNPNQNDMNEANPSQYVYNGNDLEYKKCYTEAEPMKKAPKKNRGAAVLMAICMVATPLLGVAGGYLGVTLANDTQSGVNTTQTANNVSVTNIRNVDGLSLSQLSAQVAPTVVEITTESIAGNAFIQQYVESGAGSGVILTDDGYIVTNNHVIEGASTVKVRLHDGTQYEAKFIGTDKQTDLAVIKIEATGLEYASLSDSDDLVVGQDVVAVGNPLGQLGGTITNGIISALDRDVTIDNQTMRLLQTNAAINPGNSGGGLFNANAELVGIVNAKSGGDNIEGLGFAIPSNTVKRVTSDLIDQGYVGGRISTGMTLINITDDRTAMRYGVNENGVYIYSVASNSSSEVAGLKSGDRIASIDGEEIDDVQDIKEVFEAKGVGETVTVEYYRNGERAKTDLLLTELVPDNLG